MQGVPSFTPKILAHLQTLEVQREFTAKEVHASVPEASIGSISGYLYKCVEHGMLERVGYREDADTRRRKLVYRVLDPTVPVSAGKWSSHGGIVGRKMLHHAEGLKEPLLPPWAQMSTSEPAAMTPKALVERLLSLAGEVEAMQPALETIPTDALIAELRRRIGK